MKPTADVEAELARLDARRRRLDQEIAAAQRRPATARAHEPKPMQELPYVQCCGIAFVAGG